MWIYCLTSLTDNYVECRNVLLLASRDYLWFGLELVSVRHLELIALAPTVFLGLFELSFESRKSNGDWSGLHFGVFFPKTVRSIVGWPNFWKIESCRLYFLTFNGTEKKSKGLEIILRYLLPWVFIFRSWMRNISQKKKCHI